MTGIAKIQTYFKNCMESPAAKKVGSLAGRAVEVMKSSFNKIAEVAQNVFKKVKQNAIKAKDFLKEHVFEPMQKNTSKAVKAVSSRIEEFRAKHCLLKGCKKA